MDQDRFVELAPDYALGLLEGDDLEQFERHLAAATASGTSQKKTKVLTFRVSESLVQQLLELSPGGRRPSAGQVARLLLEELLASRLPSAGAVASDGPTARQGAKPVNTECAVRRQLRDGFFDEQAGARAQ